jgi:tetratricopeptide (TPR) repeat protein
MDARFRLPKVLSASFVAVLLGTAGTLNAQDRYWDEQITRAQEAIAAGRYDEGAGLATDALKLIGGRDAKDPRRAEAINLLGVAAHLQGRLRESEVLFEDAIAIWRARAEPAERISLSISLFNLGETQIENEEYSAAERSLTESLAVRGDSSDSPPELEGILSLLAFVYQAKGLAKEAEATAKRAVSLAKEHVGLSPELAAITYNAQGRVLWANNHCDEAVNSLREALTWATRSHGTDHPFTARAMIHLAAAYLCQSRTDLAQPLLTKALRITDQTLGPSSVRSAEALGELGRLFLRDGKFSLAQQMLDRALAIEEAEFGESGTRLLPTLKACASVCVFTGKYQEALKFASRCVEIARPIPTLRSSFAKALADRAFVEAKMGRIAEAEQDYQNAITTIEAVFGPNDGRLVPMLKDYAGFLRSAHQPGLKNLNSRIKMLQAAMQLRPRDPGRP